MDTSDAAPATHAIGTHQRILIRGLHLHLVEVGTGPLVVLLHGFPECWYSWRHQLPALADAGFRAVAPDLRGYNLSDKPPGVRNYQLKLVVEDVAGLIRQLGAPHAVVVGHDWGGVIAWQLAADHPELVSRLVVLNAPHPSAFRRELRRPWQWLRSWYILFFQLPALPEWLMGWGDYALLERTLTAPPIRPGGFTPEDIRVYKHALARPGARAAALSYYRAALRYRRETARHRPPITVPTLLIWGERDPYLGIGLSDNLNAWVPNLRVERLADAGHWVQNEEPERVNRLILDFLRSAGPEA
jgi:pimeloyl-ACP methyl ester carboxylesterase